MNLSYTTILSIVLFILLIPLIANQLLSDFSWDIYDFIVAAILLFSLGVGVKICSTIVKSRWASVIICVILGLLFSLIYAELAVGIFGSPFAGN